MKHRIYEAPIGTMDREAAMLLALFHPSMRNAWSVIVSQENVLAHSPLSACL